MPAVMWGTKERDETVGAMAMDCPACFERTVADVCVISQASHVYFIAGRFRETARYAICRLCGSFVAVPTGSGEPVEIAPETVLADDDLVRQTHPALLELEPGPPPGAEPPPEGLSHAHMAFVKSIPEALKRRSRKVGGWSGGVAVLGLLSAIAMAAVVNGTAGPEAALGLGAVVLAGAAAGAVWLHLDLVHGGVARRRRAGLRRLLEHTGTDYNSLVAAVAYLDKGRGKALRHLRKARDAYLT